MPTLTVTDEQVIELIEQLPPERMRKVLFKLAEKALAERDARMATGEAHIRKVCAERGLNWDAMTEDEREAFMDDYLHED